MSITLNFRGPEDPHPGTKFIIPVEVDQPGVPPISGMYRFQEFGLGFSTNGGPRFLIDDVGRLIAGSTSGSIDAVTPGGAVTAPWSQQHGFNGPTATSLIGRWNNNALGPIFTLAKSRSSAIGGHQALGVNDEIGTIHWIGSNGVGFSPAAYISCISDNSFTTSSSPSRIVFGTTPSASTSSLQRLIITSSGKIRLVDSSAEISPLGTASSIRIEGDDAGTGAALEAWGGSHPVLPSQFVIRQGPQNVFRLFPSGALDIQSLNGQNLTLRPGDDASITATGTLQSTGSFRTAGTITRRIVPTNSNVTATATVESLTNGLRTGTPSAAVNLQMPTGSSLEAAFSPALAGSQAIEWSLINNASVTGRTITVTSNTGHTLVGSMSVDAGESGRFLTRRTTANTFITYRAA